MRIAIIEDEIYSFNRLKKLLEEINPQIEIVGPIVSVDEVKEILQDNELNGIFSDIEIEGGTVFDGFTDASVSVPVVFTTAYEAYALPAFKNNGIDYLLKPVERDDVRKALEKLTAFQRAKSPMDVHHLATLLQPKQYRSRFLIYQKDELCSVQVDDISGFLSTNGVTKVLLNSGKTMVVQQSLNDLEQGLDPQFFFRVNRQYIVHIDSIEKIVFLSESKLQLYLREYPRHEIMVSRAKIQSLKQWLDR